MIHPQRHDFSNSNHFINTYTRAKINKHVIWEMKLYRAIGTLWTVISSAALSSRGKQMKLMNKSKTVYIKFIVGMDLDSIFSPRDTLHKCLFTLSCICINIKTHCKLCYLKKSIMNVNLLTSFSPSIFYLSR